MNIDPQERLRNEWPSAYSAMLSLSGVDFSYVGDRTNDSIDPAPDGAQKVFTTVSEQHSAILARTGEPFSAESIKEFLSAIWRLPERFIGSFESTGDLDYRRAVYSLVYLAKTRQVVELLLQAYVPLLRPGLWDSAFRYKVEATFLDDVNHLLYDLEGLDESGDNEPFDWLGNLNHFSESERRPLLEMAELPPLDHPGFPPQDVWLFHASAHPIPEPEYLEMLEDLYNEMGYAL
jgi:hypothetical protein